MNRERENELRATFNHFDRDGNGRIDRAELEMVVKALGASMGAAELDTAFAVLDADSDGSIDFAEFLTWFRA